MQVENLSTNGMSGHRHSKIGFIPMERGTFSHYIRGRMGARVGLGVLKCIYTEGAKKIHILRKEKTVLKL
jgi:hypothetical protein